MDWPDKAGSAQVSIVVVCLVGVVADVLINTVGMGTASEKNQQILTMLGFLVPAVSALIGVIVKDTHEAVNGGWAAVKQELAATRSELVAAKQEITDLKAHVTS